MNSSTEEDKNYAAVSKIPAPRGRFRRSASVRIRGEKANVLFHPVTSFPSISEKDEFKCRNTEGRGRWPLNLNRSCSETSVINRNNEDDLDSLDSFFSNASCTSIKSSCEHARFAKNGTTYSGRLHKYIIHCQTAQEDPDVYLTPTQRANRSIRKLKSLLQLAKEKLRQKEEEIFKLTKEVVELKVFKASLNSQFSQGSSLDLKDLSSEAEEKSVINCDENIQMLNSSGSLHKMKDLSLDTYNDYSPSKNSFYFEDNPDDILKMSPVSPHQCSGEKISGTPDFLLSSLADSGNFDDMASSLSLYSKDSIGFANTSDFHFSKQKELNEPDQSNSEEMRLLNVYEEKLREKKLEYESELKQISHEQEENNVKMIREFERKLKEEELKFEERWMKLLKSSEEEKKTILDRFEQKLGEEREKYLEELTKSYGRRASESSYGEDYIHTVEKEKSIYQDSLQKIKSNFETEKLHIENNFDHAMKEERRKFEENISSIKHMNSCRINELLDTIADLESRYKELLPKYETMLNTNTELETENKTLKQALDEQEERHKNAYMKLYMKDQEASCCSQPTDDPSKEPRTVTVPELLVQLEVTKAELENLKAMYKRLAEAQANSASKDIRDENNSEATLQFLKSAVYYFLTDRENHLGHLRAIESILGFNAQEKSNIEKNYSW